MLTSSLVFSGYFFVRCGSVRFFLKFVQQVLPQSSVGENLWRSIAPADQGETAADVEIQQHFMITKRAHAAIEVPTALQQGEEFALTSGFQFMSTPSGVQPVRSI